MSPAREHWERQLAQRVVDEVDARLTFRILTALPRRGRPKPTRQRTITAFGLLASALAMPLLVSGAPAAVDVTPVGMLVALGAYAGVASLSFWGIAGALD